jgi:hypothetical protein
MSAKKRVRINDEAWGKIFSKYDIVAQVNRYGMFEITASQIKEFREPRLMTKFDHKNNLPELFKKNCLSILPVTRGSYVIGRFEAYHFFEGEEDEIIPVTFPEHIESIDFKNITSESTAINAAYVTTILEDFLEEEGLLPTVSGRMSSNEFNFCIYDNEADVFEKISVKNSQVEIDGGYEGYDSLALLEAKNTISDDFLIRQLYYPYRLWNSKVSKKVRPVFLVYSNGIFTLSEYEFEDLNVYNSCRLVKKSRYSIMPVEIGLDDIIEISKNIDCYYQESDTVPFPQADRFDRIVNLCERIHEEGFIPKTIIRDTYDFDLRQVDYYTNSAIYLGLVDKIRNEDSVIGYVLSELGEQVFKLDLHRRNLKYVELILSHEPFKRVFDLCLKKSEMPKRKQIVDIMMKCDLYNISSMDTYKRRASSIRGWLEWIMDLVR